jgi:hypothetical protein
MRRDDLLNILKRRPFKPFRVTVSTGETFDVTHPEMMLIAETFVAIAMPRPGASLPENSNLAWIDLVHVVHCQPLENAAA